MTAYGNLNQLKPTREQIIAHYMERYQDENNTAFSKSNIAVELMETLIKMKGVNERG